VTHRRARAVLVACLSSVVLGACTTSTPAQPPTAFGDVPITAGTTQGSAALVVLPMGDLTSPIDTFYQLLAERPGGRWALRTPIGTATNGGLVASVSLDGSLSVSVLASQNLASSPLSFAASTSAPFRPGLLPDALRSAPDALAATTGQVVAIEQGANAAVGSRDGWTWRAIATPLGLGPLTARCGATTLDALARTPSGLVVGVTCEHGSAWPLAAGTRAPVLVGGTAAAPGASATRCLRLASTTSGLVALLETTAAVGTTLRWVTSGTSSGGRRWRTEATAVLPARASSGVTATALDASEGAAVLVGGAGGAPASVVVLRAGQVPSAERAPPRAVAVGFTTTGMLVAFSVNRSVLTVSALRDGRWSVVQDSTIPIVYGSSH
jgi:hypothetical protein